MESAKASAESAEANAKLVMSSTPEGFDELVETVGLMDIATSTDYILPNSKHGGLKLTKIVGNSEQNGTPTPENPIEIESVEGKNLIPYPYNESSHEEDGVSWVLNNDGTITANGTATDDSWFDLDTDLKLLGGKYTLTGCPSGGSSSKYEIIVWDGISVIFGRDYGSGATFSVKESDILTVRCIVRSGATVNNLTFKPMLRKADIADNTYVPYGHIGVKAVGKNLLPYPYLQTTLDRKGVAWTDNGDGTITANNTATANSYFYFNKYAYDGWLLPAGNYIFSAETEGTIGTIGVEKRNISDDAYIGRYVYNTSLSSMFTVSEEDVGLYYAGFVVCVPNTKTANNLTFKPMLRRCDENGNPIGDDIFESYREHIEYIKLSEPLRKIGSVADRIVKNNGVWGVERCVGEFVYDGSSDENWVLNTSIANVFYSSLNIGMKASNRVICSHYEYNPATAFADSDYKIATDSLLSIKNKDVSTLADFKALLSAEPITVDYILATPTIETLDTQSQIALNSLKTFDTVTHITVDSVTQPAELEVEFGKSKVGAYTLKSLNDNDIGKVSVESGEAAVDFESEDSSNATAWTNVNLLQAGETLKSILGKISTMFRNIRWLKSEVDKKANVLIGYLTNTDLNYAITSENRAYRCDTTCTNLPVSGVGGLLEVFPNDEVEKITQRFTTDEGEIFTRYNTYPTLGVWSDWMASTGIMTLSAYLTSESDSGGEVALVSSSSIDIKSSVCIGFKYTTDEGIIYLNTIPTTSGKRIIPELKVEVISSNTYINVKPIDEDGAWPEIKAGTIELYLQRK